MEHKKLYRSSKDRMIAGVCGGIAQYFSFDANIIRIAVLILTVCTGFVPVMIIYAGCALILPLEPVKPSEDTVDVLQK